MRSLSFFYFWTWFIETSFGISNDCCVLRLQFKGAAARAWKRTNANNSYISMGFFWNYVVIIIVFQHCFIRGSPQPVPCAQIE